MSTAAGEDATTRSGRVAVWVAGLLLALPTVLVRFPPMSDLPLHAAMVGVLRNFGDVARYPPGLYILNLGHPNQLFHLLAAVLAFVVGTELACKLVVAGAQVAILVAGGRLAHHLGRSRWTALLLAPLALGWAYFWGLAANLVGMAVLLLALPSFDRATVRPSWRTAVTGTGWMITLYLAHESVLVVGCVAMAIFAFGRPVRGRDTPLRLAPIVAAVGIVLVQLRVQHHLQAGAKATSGVEFDGLGTSLAQIPETLFGALDAPEEIGVSALAVLALLILGTERWRARTPASAAASRRTLAERIHQRRFEVVALVCMLAYLVTPFQVAGGTMLHQRFLLPAYGLAVLCVAPPVAPMPRLALLLLAAFPTALLVVAVPQFLDADRSHKELDALFVRLPEGAAVAYLEADPHPAGRLYNVSVGAARVVEARGGRTMYSLTQSVISPVQIAPASRWDEAQDRVLTNGLFLEPSRDLRMFHYLLVHSDRALLAEATVLALGDDAHLLARDGGWSLFEATAPAYSLTAAELPPPDGRTTTLQERTAAALRAMSERIGEPGR